MADPAEILDLQIKLTREDLIRRLTVLSEDMQYQAKKLSENPHWMINELGILQSQGVFIDTCAAKYATLTRMRRMIIENSPY